MVRSIELKLIDDELSRQLSFAKRRNGLIKKALELSMVCGVDCLFISFSPSGRLSYFSGDKRIEDVFARFATVPEHLQKFHLSELELQQLVSILRELKEQTEEHIEHDRTIFGVQQEILQVKEDIQRAIVKIRRYQPLTKAIMTVTETNTSECFLEEALAKVQERKKELTGYHDNIDASQPYDSMVALENASANPSDEVHQSELDHQPNQDSKKNQDQKMSDQSPATEGEVTAMMESCPPASLIFEMASPQPYQAGTSFTSLLLSADVAEETLSPIKEIVPVMPQQNNNGSFQPSQQYSVFQDGVLNTQFYSNDNTTAGGNKKQSSEQNGSTYENDTPIINNMNNLSPVSNLTPPDPDFGLPGTFQMPQQIQLQPSAPNFAAVSFPFLMGNGIAAQPQMPMPMGGTTTTIPPTSTPNATTTSSPLFSSLLWNNQNPTQFGERGGFQELLNSVAGLNMFQDARTPAFSTPPNLLMNHQSMGGQTMDLSVPINMQGSLGNSSSQGMQGNQISVAPRRLEAGGPSSSAQKRKLPWDDDIFLRLSNNQSGNAASNVAPPAPRPPRNLTYNTAYEIMGLAIDPHFRMFHEMNKNGKGKQQLE